MTPPRDHGGGLDAAIANFGGRRADWLDLSTGINPRPYPITDIPTQAWMALPDSAAQRALEDAARQFWDVPVHFGILAAPGASALIARMPDLTASQRIYIPSPTYNEHAAAFEHAGRQVVDDPNAPCHVYVSPNNPDGRIWGADVLQSRDLTVIDESFGDVVPDDSHVPHIANDKTVVLKSFGKFWGLAGMRLGFAIAMPGTIQRLKDLIGPWPVAGPALSIGAKALTDQDWANSTRIRLKSDAQRLDDMAQRAGMRIIGGTDLFRLYEVDDAPTWQTRLAQHHIWSRIFPYSQTWLRLGLPAHDRWEQLEAAL